MKTPLTRAAAVAAALMLSLAAGCTSKATPPVESSSLHPAQKRNTAPDFALKDASGRELKLSDYRGKVVLLNFWATWCGPCRIEIPWFKDFQQTYKDKGFTVIGVAVDDEGWEVVKPYIAQKQFNYPVVLGTESMEQHYGGIDSLPTTFIIDKEGRIASTHIGLVSKQDYEVDIQELLR